MSTKQDIRKAKELVRIARKLIQAEEDGTAESSVDDGEHQDSVIEEALAECGVSATVRFIAD